MNTDPTRSIALLIEVSRMLTQHFGTVDGTHAEMLAAKIPLTLTDALYPYSSEAICANLLTQARPWLSTSNRLINRVRYRGRITRFVASTSRLDRLLGRFIFEGHTPYLKRVHQMIDIEMFPNYDRLGAALQPWRGFFARREYGMNNISGQVLDNFVDLILMTYMARQTDMADWTIRTQPALHGGEDFQTTLNEFEEALLTLFKPMPTKHKVPVTA